MSYEDRMHKGEAWLSRNARNLFAETENNLSFKDNFVELLILELTGNWRLVDLRVPRGKWNYFGGKPIITTDPYPAEVDTNAIAATIIPPTDSTAHSLMDEMLLNTNDEGIVKLYYDPDRTRVIPEVVTNVLTFFYTWGRGHELQKCLDYVYSVLQNRSHHPNRYYFQPESFFFYLYRLLRVAGDEPELQKFKRLLITRVEERIGTQTENALCLATRLLICHHFNIPNHKDIDSLVQRQEEDGCFGVGWCYTFGRTQIKIGHRGYTCALATEAIKAHLQTEKKAYYLSTMVKSYTNAGVVDLSQKLAPVSCTVTEITELAT